MKRVFLAIGSLALVALLGVTMIGRSAVDAQTGATPEAGSNSQSGEKESMKDTYLATLAEKLGVSVEDLQTAIDETNAELNLNGSPNDGMHGHGNRDGQSGAGNGGMRERDRDHMMGNIKLSEAAAFLAITEDQLKTELQGSTFLKVAAAHGKTTDDVRAFLIAQATVAIDARLQEAESDAAASSDATEVPAAPAITPTATT